MCREEFLACARLSQQQDRHVGACDLRRLSDRVLKQWRRSDHLRCIADQFSIALILTMQVRPVERVLDHEQDTIAGQRLLQEVEGTHLRRLHRVGHRAMSGDHDDYRPVIRLPYRAQYLDTVAVGQPNVEQIEIASGPIPLGGESGHRIKHAHAVALALEDQAKRPPDVCLVVDDDDVPLAGHDGSDTLNAAPPNSPGMTVMSPPDSSAFFFAIDKPSPMPCFLKVIVGSNNLADTSSLKPGPESCTSISTRGVSVR